jgi:hypothetical protein
MHFSVLRPVYLDRLLRAGSNAVATAFTRIRGKHGDFAKGFLFNQFVFAGQGSHAFSVLTFARFTFIELYQSNFTGHQLRLLWKGSLLSGAPEWGAQAKRSAGI